ncbi:MAG: hypothetical protein NW223_09230 [Hyphomicrobiaceae bacterium]|nr:hypothetical protein [Hyphomicrobiaceae bacterium]
MAKIRFKHVAAALHSLAGRALKRTDASGATVRALLAEEYEQSIRGTFLASSRGVLHCTDIHISAPRSSTRRLPDLGRLVDPQRTAPCSVYVCTDALEDFAAAINGRKLAPFTLVSGDSDRVAGTGAGNQVALNIAGHPSLVAWYAQNAGFTSPKVAPLPIGLDFHTAWTNPAQYGPGPRMPANQERLLFEILAASPTFDERQAKCYCDWHFNARRGDRRVALARLAPEVAHFVAHRVARSETWRLQSGFRFVLSPLGAGWDCHRTWEALALGCIPIVSRCPITALFSDLPVIVVDDWATVTPAFLARAQDHIAQQEFDFSTLLLGHWRARIAGGHAPRLPRMRFADFRSLLTSHTTQAEPARATGAGPAGA